METVGNPAFEQRSYFLVIDLSQIESYPLILPSVDVSSSDC